MAADAYLKIDTIEGESLDEKHPNEIEINSFSWGISNSGTSASGTGAGQGKASHNDFSYTCTMGKSSPKIIAAVGSGQHIAKAVFTNRKAGGGTNHGLDFMVYTFTDILISSYNVSGMGGENPSESISFNYSKVEVAYCPQKKDGTLDAAIKKVLDLKLNKIT